MRFREHPRRIFMSLLIGALSLVGAAQAAAPAAAAATGPTSLGASGWQIYPESNYVYNWNSTETTHGAPQDFSVAPAVPAEGDAGWSNCGANSPTRYGVPMCPSASTIDMHLTSILPACWVTENFTFFQSLVSIPAGTNVSQFSVALSGADDGARVSLFNSKYPSGLVIPGSYIDLAGGTGATADLSSYVVPGEVNRVVITQVDDCPTGNNLASAQIYLNGTALQHITASASPASTTWTNTSTISASGYSGSGAITYSLDEGSNGHTSDSVCSLSGSTVSASGPGDCYVYAQIAASSDYQAATSSDVEVTFNNPIGLDPTVNCTTNAGIFNTGYDASTQTTLPYGAQDPSWMVSGPYGAATPAEPMAPPSNAAYSPAHVYTNSAYYEDPSYTSSQYIGAQGIEANYYFSYTFNLASSVNPANFKLDMDFYADNQVAQVYVNGQPQLAAPQGGSANDQYTGFVNGKAASTALASDWQSGQNTIVVDVLNGGGPYAFDAQMRSSASCTATPPTITDIPGTSTNPSATYGGGFTATVGGSNSDGTASVTSDTPPTCTTSGTNGLTVDFVGAGTCTLTSHVGEGSLYLPTDGAPQSFTIAPAPLTVTASSPADMTYGGSVPAVTPSYSGFVNGDTASSLTTSPTCATTATSSSPVGTYDTSCSGAEDPNYSISYVDGSLSVDQAALTVTASDAGMNYGGSVPTIKPIYSGFVNGDTASSLTTPASCSTTATSSSSVGEYPSSCSGAVDPNYSISYAAGSVSIAPVTLTITASSRSMTYGDAAPTVTAKYSGFVNGDTASSLTSAPTCSTTAGPTSQVGSLQTTSCAGAADPNYTIVYADGVVIVNPAPLTITASSGTSVYGSAVPGVTASFSGFKNGDNASSLGSGFSCSTTATSSSGVGDYTTSCSGANDANYAITYADGSMTITPAPLTITASSPSMTYGGSLPAVTASYTGFVNGDTVASLSTAPTCGTKATASSPVGTYDTSCAGAADPNYTISYVDGSLTINPAPLTITASSPTMTYAATVPTITASYTGFVNGDTASSLTTAPVCGTTATTTSQPGTYATSCSGAADPNYTISYVGGTLKLLLVAACPNSVYYGTGNNLAGANFSGKNLTGKSFVGDDLVGANFDGANLKNADFTGADLQGATFKGANLMGATLTGANLYATTLSGTNLMGDDVSCADLQGASLTGANLKGSNLSGDNLESATFTGVNLMNADLSHVDAKGASFTGANLKGIEWDDATCPDGGKASADGLTCPGTL